MGRGALAKVIHPIRIGAAGAAALETVDRDRRRLRAGTVLALRIGRAEGRIRHAMQSGRRRARACVIWDVARAAGEGEARVIAGDAFAVPEKRLVRTALRHAFAADEFERVDFAGHGDAAVAQADARHGKDAAAAILGVAANAGAAVA